MNKLIASLFLTLFLFSCSEKNTNTDNVQADSIQTTNNSTINAGATLADKLDGLWISESYLKNIETRQSIYKSREYDSKVLGFSLDKKTMLSDTAMLEGFTTHEGGYSSLIKYDTSKGKFVNNLEKVSEYAAFPEPFELNYDGGTILEMFFPKTNKTDRYRKVDTNLDTELRRILIAGDYKIGNDGSVIHFDSDGKVQNFQDFKSYELVYDFGEGIEYDAIIFFKDVKAGNWVDGVTYTFKKTPNSLRLQYVNTNWDTMEHKISDEVLVLEKK
ncbi:hypothetical protein QNI19_27440 [Cytophagaceae bacterium DM2B3-1]|uniref:Lipoprotein n=1 Tax=Xanthocytophaga flava TaxID=3048013 RepID=A0ABT7CSG0_9BACT|nr:hypothetical protein [Xanthocytophaga flavus]MDJ1471427.1 hypothetical protein [Xanthocytophaga flavus]MDJ1496698.1 hypothetical protein [Xanthocytophaga flavus]